MSAETIFGGVFAIAAAVFYAWGKWGPVASLRWRIGPSASILAIGIAIALWASRVSCM